MLELEELAVNRLEMGVFFFFLFGCSSLRFVIEGAVVSYLLGSFRKMFS